MLPLSSTSWPTQPSRTTGVVSTSQPLAPRPSTTPVSKARRQGGGCWVFAPLLLQSLLACLADCSLPCLFLQWWLSAGAWILFLASTTGSSATPGDPTGERLDTPVSSWMVLTTDPVDCTRQVMCRLRDPRNCCLPSHGPRFHHSCQPSFSTTTSFPLSWLPLLCSALPSFRSTCTRSQQTPLLPRLSPPPSTSERATTRCLHTFHFVRSSIAAFQLANSNHILSTSPPKYQQTTKEGGVDVLSLRGNMTCILGG